MISPCERRETKPDNTFCVNKPLIIRIIIITSYRMNNNIFVCTYLYIYIYIYIYIYTLNRYMYLCMVLHIVQITLDGIVHFKCRNNRIRMLS